MRLNEYTAIVPFRLDARAEPRREEPGVLRFGPFGFNRRARLLDRDGEPVAIGSRAYDLLDLLIARAGDVVPKPDLLAHAWPNLHVEESSLRRHISVLRRALGDGVNGARYVTNVAGRGYCFVGAVEGAGFPLRHMSETAQENPDSLPGRCLQPTGREAADRRSLKTIESERLACYTVEPSPALPWIDITRENAMTVLLTKTGDIQGMALTGLEGAKLGSVRELFVDLATGRIEFLIVEAGGLLGGSGKFHPVPWRSLRYDAVAKAFQIDMSKSAFKGSPSYDRDQLGNPNYGWNEQASLYFAGSDPA